MPVVKTWTPRSEQDYCPHTFFIYKHVLVDFLKGNMRASATQAPYAPELMKKPTFKVRTRL